ncbi:MAG: transposase [Solobacterium sp.]|nr:transposase [Solobacterium sp.]
MKLNYEEKIEIYNERKLNHKSLKRIAKERGPAFRAVEYMVRSAVRHGIEALKHKWTYYSPEFKEAAVKRVMPGRESVNEVSLDIGLSNHGTVSRWIKEYKENGYTVIERIKGRNAKEETGNGSGI